MKYLPDMEVIQSDVMDKVREAVRNMTTVSIQRQM